MLAWVFVCICDLILISKRNIGIRIAGGLVLLAIAVSSIVFITRPSSPYESRTVIWSYAVRAIVEHPFGYGAESGTRVFDIQYGRDHIKLDDFSIDRAHNVLLDITIWSGILGGIIWIAWIVLSLQSIAAWNRVGVIALLLFGMLQPLNAIHWVLLFLILSTSSKNSA